jgi:Xaa-Pro aminopeptidase
MNYPERRLGLSQQLDANGVDALLVTRMTNIRYLTGFSGTTAFLIFDDNPVIIVDFRYSEQVEREVHGLQIERVMSARELWGTTVRLIGERGIGRLGVEGRTLTVSQFLELQGAAGFQTVATTDVVEQLRYRKEPAEIEAIRRAIELTDEALADLLTILEPGMTEHRVAGEIERLQRAKGGERSASEIIVASGPRSALPHGIATDRVLATDEPVMFDLGTVVGGYLADLTRTIHLGSPTAEFRRIYEIVGEAQRRAEAAIRPGMAAREADAVAREYISENGYGDKFGHSLGHSIGLDNHETPALSPYDDTVLEPGMVVTVEPGIYLPGVAGVRTEDVVVVTDAGCEILTRSPKELIEL